MEWILRLDAIVHAHDFDYVLFQRVLTGERPHQCQHCEKTPVPLLNTRVDLFASRLSIQLPIFISCRPDPEAMAANAFTLMWSGLRGYANPTWNLVGRVLAQAQQPDTSNTSLESPILVSNNTAMDMYTDYPCLLQWREKSSKTYESHFQKWIGIYSERNINPVSCLLHGGGG